MAANIKKLIEPFEIKTSWEYPVASKEEQGRNRYSRLKSRIMLNVRTKKIQKELADDMDRQILKDLFWLADEQAKGNDNF